MVYSRVKIDMHCTSYREKGKCGIREGGIWWICGKSNQSVKHRNKQVY